MRTLARAVVVLGAVGCTRGAAGVPTPKPPATTADAPPAGTSATDGCTVIADPEAAARLSIEGASGGIVTGIDAHPGEERALRLGHASSHAPFAAVPACARWSVTPAGAATIDAKTGRMRVSDAAAGEVLEVSAEIRGAGTKVVGTIRVVAASEADLVGTWREESRLDCATGAWTTTGASIRELAVKAGGSFGVTWTPFETYVDYWGKWTWDAGTRKLVLSITGGNYVPKDVVPTGTMQREGAALVLRDVFLGTREPNEPRACGHRFVR